MVIICVQGDVDSEKWYITADNATRTLIATELDPGTSYNLTVYSVASYFQVLSDPSEQVQYTAGKSYMFV